MDAFFFYLENLRKDSLSNQTGSAFLLQSADLYFHLLGTQKPLPSETIQAADALLLSPPTAIEDYFHYLWLLNARSRYACFIEKDHSKAIHFALQGLRHSARLFTHSFAEYDLDKKAYPLVTALVYARIYGYQGNFAHARTLMSELANFFANTENSLSSYPEDVQQIFHTNQSCFQKILADEKNRTYFVNKVTQSLTKLAQYEKRNHGKNLWQSLEYLATSCSAQKAFVDADSGRSLTWSEVLCASQNLALEIRRTKAEKTYVLLCTRQNLLFPVSLFACWLAGVTPILMNEECTDLEFQRIRKILGNEVPTLLLDEELPSECKDKFASFGTPLTIMDSRFNLDAGAETAKFSNSALALGLFTSGTSDLPKLILFTHENLYCSAEIELANEAIFKDAVIANLRPHFTSGGLNTLWPALLAGTCHVLSDKLRRRPIARYVRAFITQHAPQVLIASPAYLQSLTESLEDEPLTVQPLPTYFGGMSLPKKTVSDLSKKGLRLFMRYGMTEVGHILAKTEASRLRPAQSVGLACTGFLLKSHNRFISVSSPGVADFKMRAGNLVPLRHGEWFQTEDHGDVSSSNEVLLRGREHSIISVDGFRFHARQVESALLNSELVKECCAVGIPHDRHGQQLVIFIVPASAEVTSLEDNLRLFMQQNLSAPLRPSKYVFLSELPRQTNGKVHFSHLKARAERKD